MVPAKKHLGVLLLAAITTLGLATLLVVAPPTAQAQAVSGDIIGTVTDPTKAAIAQASVEATNVATGVAFSGECV